AEEIGRATGSRSVLPIAADLATKEGCEVFVQTALAAYGAIDVLVVNAAGPPPGRFDDLDDDAWDKAFELTLMSAVRLTRLALPPMRRQKSGSIVFSTPDSRKQPTPDLTR